jgi:hypothetical protein
LDAYLVEFDHGEVRVTRRTIDPILGGIAFGAIVGGPFVGIAIYLDKGPRQFASLALQGPWWRFAILALPLLLACVGLVVGRAAARAALAGTKGADGTLRWRCGEEWQSVPLGDISEYLLGRGSARAGIAMLRRGQKSDLIAISVFIIGALIALPFLLRWVLRH